MKSYVAILYGLHVIWTGVLRSIEAQEFKPNAFWFCLTMGLIAIGSGFLFQIGKNKIAMATCAIAAGVVLAFYMNCLIVQPEKDASFRVGLVILSSIAALAFILLPPKRVEKTV